jgi:hypothetical protein
MSTNLGPVVKRNIRLEYDATWEYEVGLDKDSATSELAYEDNFDGWEQRLPILKSEHPDIRNLKLVKIKAKLQEGGKIRVALSYSAAAIDVPGFENGGSRTQRFGCEPGLSEEPIMTFAKLKDIDDQSRDALSNFLNSNRSQLDYDIAVEAIGADPLALLALEKIRKGQDGYRTPSMIWIQRRKLRSLASLPTEKIGKIDNPPGDPPTGPPDSNWMYLAPIISPTEDGDAWDVEERWEQSYEGGWDEFFYAPAEPPEP